MPVNQKYSIYGKVFDGASNLLSGVTVNLINAGNGEQLPTASQGLTGSKPDAGDGEFSINAEDLTTSITDGQEYEVVFSKNGYEDFKVVGTFVIAGAGDEIIIDLMKEGVKTANFEKDSFELKLSQAKVTFQIWSDDFTGSGTAEVVTTGGGHGRGVTDTDKPIINLKPGQVAYIQFMGLRLNTASKNATLQVVKCSEKDGGGTATAVGHKIHDFTGTNVERGEYLQHDMPMFMVPYDATNAKSVAMQLNTSTGSVIVDINIEGFVLEE